MASSLYHYTSIRHGVHPVRARSEVVRGRRGPFFRSSFMECGRDRRSAVSWNPIFDEEVLPTSSIQQEAFVYDIVRLNRSYIQFRVSLAVFG